MWRLMDKSQLSISPDLKNSILTLGDIAALLCILTHGAWTPCNSTAQQCKQPSSNSGACWGKDSSAWGQQHHNTTDALRCSPNTSPQALIFAVPQAAVSSLTLCFPGFHNWFKNRMNRRFFPLKVSVPSLQKLHQLLLVQHGLTSSCNQSLGFNDQPSWAIQTAHRNKTGHRTGGKPNQDFTLTNEKSY